MKLATLRRLRGNVEDQDKTERLKRHLAALVRRRRHFYLTRAELEPILRWKLRTQYPRGARVRQNLTDPLVRRVTRAAFAYQAADGDRELRVRTRLLSTLPGIGVPIASAILALVEPYRYCVVDFRGWRAVFGEERRQFSTRAYQRYRAAIAKLAHKLGWPIQETDSVVWEYDRRRTV